MRTFWAACAALPFAFACGDSSSGVSTGLPASTPLASMTDAEVRTLCEDFTAATNDEFSAITDEDICVYEALVLTVDEDGCQNLVDLCLASGEVPDRPFPSLDPVASCMDATVMDFEGCEEVTTGELEGCLNAVLDGFSMGVASLDCALAGDATFMALFLDGFSSEACTAIPPTCLGAFDSEMEDEAR